MSQGLKAFLIGAATTFASTFGLKAQENNEQPNQNNGSASVNTTILAKDSTISHEDSIPNILEADSLRRDSLLARIDMIKADTDSLVKADTITSKFHPQFDAAREDMFYLILHFEDVKVIPYKLKGENFYTYGIGNTLTETGRRVRPTDRIRNEEHLMQVMNRHIDEHIYPKMSNLFNLDSLSKQEIAVLGSIAYNAGEGYLAQLKPYIDNYIKDRNDSIAKKQLTTKIKTRNKSCGRVLQGLVARRDFECKVLTGEIILCTGRECTASNELNLKEVAVGGWSYAYYRDKNKRMTKRANCNQSGAEVCDSITECPGKRPQERIDTALMKSKTRPKARQTKVAYNNTRTRGGK